MKTPNYANQTNLQATLVKLALGHNLTKAEVEDFGNAVLLPVCGNPQVTWHLANWIGQPRISRPLFSHDPRVEEAMQIVWEALSKHALESGLSAWQHAAQLLGIPKKTFADAQTYLQKCARLALLADAENVSFHLKARTLVLDIVGKTVGLFTETSGRRKLWMPADGTRWPAMPLGEEVDYLARDVAAALGLKPVKGPLEKHLAEGTIRRIVEKGFAIAGRKLDTNQLTTLVLQALGLGGMKAQPVTIGDEDEENGAPRCTEACLHNAWAEYAMDTNKPITSEVNEYLQHLERHLEIIEGRPLAMALETSKKGSVANTIRVILAQLEGSSMSACAPLSGCKVTALQEQCDRRGWNVKKLNEWLHGSSDAAPAAVEKLRELFKPLCECGDADLVIAVLHALAEKYREHLPVAA